MECTTTGGDHEQCHGPEMVAATHALPDAVGCVAHILNPGFATCSLARKVGSDDTARFSNYPPRSDEISQ